MSSERDWYRRSGRPQGWLRIGLILLVLGFVAYRQWQAQQPPAHNPAMPVPRSQPRPAADDSAPSAEHQEATVPANAAAAKTKFFNQTIYDQDGEVAYRGTIDLGPTLARIERHERLGFPNDGVTFQNRERRLPQHSAGYYHEYVHPTPDLRGPGPQRIITGKEGELYYTADHYRTFQRLDQP